MWIALSGSFLSVVADRNSKEYLLVRARVEGHIEAVFPDAKVFTNKNADYFYRALIPRGQVADAVAESIRNIDYDNFKNSVTSVPLHDAYLEIWEEMKRLQDKIRGK